LVSSLAPTWRGNAYIFGLNEEILGKTPTGKANNSWKGAGISTISCTNGGSTKPSNNQQTYRLNCDPETEKTGDIFFGKPAFHSNSDFRASQLLTLPAPLPVASARPKVQFPGRVRTEGSTQEYGFRSDSNWASPVHIHRLDAGFCWERISRRKIASQKQIELSGGNHPSPIPPWSLIWSLEQGDDLIEEIFLELLMCSLLVGRPNYFGHQKDLIFSNFLEAQCSVARGEKGPIPRRGFSPTKKVSSANLFWKGYCIAVLSVSPPPKKTEPWVDGSVSRITAAGSPSLNSVQNKCEIGGRHAFTLLDGEPTSTNKENLKAEGRK